MKQILVMMAALGTFLFIAFAGCSNSGETGGLSGTYESHQEYSDEEGEVQSLTFLPNGHLSYSQKTYDENGIIPDQSYDAKLLYRLKGTTIETKTEGHSGDYGEGGEHTSKLYIQGDGSIWDSRRMTMSDSTKAHLTSARAAGSGVFIKVNN